MLTGKDHSAHRMNIWQSEFDSQLEEAGGLFEGDPCFVDSKGLTSTSSDGTR